MDAGGAAAQPGQLAAYRAEEWGAMVAEYSAASRDVLAAWRYLQAHPIFWSWALPGDLADIDPVAIDETQWACIEAESWLDHGFGLAHLSVELIRSPGRPPAARPATRPRSCSSCGALATGHSRRAPDRVPGRRHAVARSAP